MKTFLIPYDFSAPAQDGLEYGIELAKALGAKIILLHVETEKTSDEHSEITARRLLKKCLGITRNNGIACDYVTETGSLVENIKNTAKLWQANLVIMGTGGESDFGKVLFGSNSALTVNEAMLPVLTVPAGYSFKGIRKITFATDYLSSDPDVLEEVLNYARPFRAQVNLLHIYDSEKGAHWHREESKRFMEKIISKAEYNNLSFQILNGPDHIAALQEYLYDNGADLLVMSTHHRNLIQKLLGKSETNEMIYRSNVPLMAFHHQKESAVKLF